MNEFIRRLYSHPGLMWKAGAAILFISIAFVIYFVPSMLGDIDDSKRAMLALFIGGYGLFRLVTFYVEYQQVKNEER